MTLSTAEITSVVHDLKPKLEGGRIERIDQPGEHRLVLHVRNGSARYWLLLSAHPRFSRLHLLTKRPQEGPPVGGFCNVVRQHLTSSSVVRLRQMPRDRLLVLESSERDSLMREHPVKLVAELVGVSSNFVLLDEDDRVLGCLQREESARRTLVPGVPYAPLRAPESLPERALENRFQEAASADDPMALHREIEKHYLRLEATESIETARSELLGELRAQADRRQRRLENLQRELERAERAEEIRRKGELLKIALPEVKRGQRTVEVRDFYEPDNPAVTIELDPAKTPEQNLQEMFEEYKKARAGRETLQDRIEQTRRELGALETLVARAEGADDETELEDMRNRALKAGLLVPERHGHARRREGRSGPRRFVSKEGLEILVARSQKQNEELTFTIARGNDYWLHVLGWPGPHVVVRKPKDRSVSSETLLDAAHLAIHYSKIRGTDYAEVIYTQRKHVRRLRGAPTGTVSYANTKTLQVRVSPARIQRLMARRAAEQVQARQ